MQKMIKQWLSVWLYVITAIGGFLAALLICNWDVWPMHTTLAVAADIALVLHVLEEWKFPGGFYYMYNLMHKSPEQIADRYPMSQLTDMITNLIPIVFGCTMLAIGMPYFISLMWFLLSAMEVVVHTMAGVHCIRLFGKYGKKSLYNPGLFTSYFCFSPVFIGYIYSFVVYRVPTVVELLLAVVCTLAMTYLVIFLAEKKLKDENSPYIYNWGRGYFEKFWK
ncbi:MAG: HXXEE domain-containing protein [Faecousia sp.]